MKMALETIDAHDVRILRAGKGPRVLFLHGFEHHPGAAPYLGSLAEDFEICAPEHVGYGPSTGFDSSFDLLDMTLHNRSIIERWADGPVDVIGHCLGGMFAAELAIIAPHLVRRLILVDSYGLWLDAQPMPDPFVLNPAQLEKAKWSDPANAAKETNAYDAATDISPQIFRSVNLAAATKFLWPIPDRGLASRIGYVRAPTLVLHGNDDGLVPQAYGEALASAIRGADHRGIAGAGHLPMVEQPDTFLSAVKGFLQ